MKGVPGKHVLFFMAMFFCSGSLLKADMHKHVIGPWPGGFFSAMCSTLANIAWADKVKKIPVVHWDYRSLYYQPGGHNGSTVSAWEYYFEPVSDATYRPGEWVYMGYCAPDNRTCIRGFTQHTYEYKKWVNSIIVKHVRIKPVIQERIDLFYCEKMCNKKTIGIHLRGTDKQWEIRLPSPEKLIEEANRVADAIDADQFFVATDEERLLQLAQNSLNRPVIYCDSYRSSNGNPVHKRPNRAQIGEEVLIETLLLSKCDWFVCSHSNVAYFVWYWRFWSKCLTFLFLKILRIVHEKNSIFSGCNYGI